MSLFYTATSTFFFFFFFFNDTATSEIYTLSLHDALPISLRRSCQGVGARRRLHWIHAPAMHRAASQATRGFGFFRCPEPVAILLRANQSPSWPSFPLRPIVASFSRGIAA